ncbi:MAG: BNR-4 repeat-containing protein, partial [Gemmatimonadota bacterium]|nr:BNR-4 repeat-containing protein [Gemmatimonadota bacterium]
GYWTAEQNLSDTATDSETGLNHAAMAVTDDGALHVVWAERDGPNQNYRIYSRQCSSGQWTPAELVVDYLEAYPGALAGAKYPALAATPDGDLHLFWHDYRVAGIQNVEIFTKTRSPGSGWDASPAADIRFTTSDHPETNGDNGYVPVPVVAESGALHVLWYDFRFDGNFAEILARSRGAGAAWDLSAGDAPDDRITADSALSELVAADAAPDGTLHAVWRSVDGGARILHALRDPATGAWTTPDTVDTAGAVGGAPALGCATDGSAHVVWPDSRDGGRALFVRVRSPGGSWSAEERITRPADGADEPSLARGPDQAMHLVWSDARVSLFNREVFLRSRAPGAPWDTTGAADHRVSDSAGRSLRPSVIAHGGSVSVLWKDDRDGDFDIHYRRLADDATFASPENPRRLAEARAWPNPSRGVPVRVHLGTGREAGTLRVVDVRGREVRRLAPPGPDSALWDLRDRRGHPVPGGVYFLAASREGPVIRITVLR